MQQVLPADVLQLLLQGEEQLQDVEQLLQGSPEVVESRLGGCHGRFQLRLAAGGGAEESREARWGPVPSSLAGRLTAAQCRLRLANLCCCLGRRHPLGRALLGS